MAVSPELRQQRSERAKKMHADGILGSRAAARKGQQRSLEVRSERASQIAQSLAEKHRDKIEAAFLAGMRSKSEATRVRAAEGLLKMALSGQRTEASEVQDVAQQHSREELLQILSVKLTSSPTAALMREQIAATQQPYDDVIEGVVVSEN